MEPRPLPQPLEPLAEMALDLRWTWSRGNDALWARLDHDLWEATGNPWLMLQLVPAERLEALAADQAFVAEVHAAASRRRAGLAAPTWFSREHPDERGLVAYFSMEFGLHEALPLYAGGLGILAGDHLKTASDLGVPLIGVGIFWQQGYFRQSLDAGGRQQELFPFNDPMNLPVQPVRTSSGDRVEVALELPGRLLRLRAWEAAVGRVRLLLLDANHLLNGPADRGLTGSLYGGDNEIRLLQELILGIAGWRLLRKLGLDPDVCHLNEGHAAFVIFERARTFMQHHDVTFHEALWATRAGNVFTTHTPVEAGFDSFGRGLIERYSAYFDEYVKRLGISWGELLALGRRDPGDPEEAFGMAYLAMRGSSCVNGVSRLHGQISRGLFQPLFPRFPPAEVPVTHVTNGIHVPSWASAMAEELWKTAAGGARWREGMEDMEEAIEAWTDERLWTLRTGERHDVVRLARSRLRQQRAQQGVTGEELTHAEQVLDPEALTIGFARRFTAYKRPNLLLRDPDRLLRLLANPARPVQLVLAGKAHPADGEGKRLIQEWMRFAADPRARDHVVFLDDYDMALAKELVEGVDVWLNTPLRPWEACGTSGMKVLVNGGLNLSALDGWWAEAYEPGNGWAIGDGDHASAADRDAREAAELYRILEEEVVPLFYQRDAAGIPRGWLRLVRTSMVNLTPRFSSNRMMREYVERFYLPAAARFRARAAEGVSLAREMAAWEDGVRAGWPKVGVAAVRRSREGESGGVRVEATVHLGSLPPESVRAELYADGEPASERIALTLRETGTAGEYRIDETVGSTRPADHFTVRILPWHPAALLPGELPLVAWER